MSTLRPRKQPTQPRAVEVICHERGSRFFCRAPGGLMFELNTRADATPEYRATFD